MRLGDGRHDRESDPSSGNRSVVSVGTALEAVPDQQLVPLGHAGAGIVNLDHQRSPSRDRPDHAAVSAVAIGVSDQIDEYLLESLTVNVRDEVVWSFDHNAIVADRR